MNLVYKKQEQQQEKPQQQQRLHFVSATAENKGAQRGKKKQLTRSRQISHAAAANHGLAGASCSLCFNLDPDLLPDLFDALCLEPLLNIRILISI